VDLESYVTMYSLEKKSAAKPAGLIVRASNEIDNQDFFINPPLKS